MARQSNSKKSEMTIDLTEPAPISREEIEAMQVVDNVDILRIEKKEQEDSTQMINPLRNEIVYVRYITNNSFPDRRHPFHGGISDKATYEFCVPSLENGTLKNPLSNAEKAFFEDVLGLEKNALSVYKKGKDNFWSTANPNGMGSVRLTKQDTRLDLSNPTDWLKLRILEMHPEIIAKSYKEIQQNSATNYKFVIIHDASEAEQKKNRQYYIKESWKALGRLEEDPDKLRYIISKIEVKPVSKNTKADVLSTKCGDLIEEDAIKFYSIITDDLFDTKVLLMKALDGGFISRRNGYYYTKDGQPMCDANQNSTEEVAAKFLNMPQNQDLLFLIQSKVSE